MILKKEEPIKSPINYTGSKYRLIKKGLIDYFPDKINTFVDLFGGSGNISANVNANNIIYNDIIHYIPNLYNAWKQQDLKTTNDYIDDTIKQWGLTSTNKEGFLEFRKHYNKTKEIQDLFILLCYSFNYQMRFNNKHEYNSSFGKEASTMNNNIRKNLNLFINRIKEQNIKFLSNDFRKLKTDILNKNDFVYVDPPYSLSCGVYQDGKRGFKGWGLQDDKDLFMLLDNLNNKGIKFAMSNLIESKGIENIELKKWVNDNNYNIIYLDMNYNGSNYQRKTKRKDSEVLIINY